MTNPTPPSGASLRGAVDLTALVQRQQAGAQPTGAHAPASADRIVVETDDASFGQVLELSRTLPVVVAVWASWSQPSQQLLAALERLVRAREGRLVLAAADADRSPQLVQALQVQSVPTVVALVAGQPVPLFAGEQPDDVISQLFDQLLELGAQHGAAGRIEAGDDDGAGANDAPEEPPLPPLHQEAYDAIERRDYDAAAAAYRTAIAQDPRDALAVAGLAQVSLLGRLAGKTLDSIRQAAAAAPDDLAAQLDVADLDVSGGHVEDAFDRLLTIFPDLDSDGRTTVRERLVELFEIVGTDDPRVAAARRRLASLLY
ncbi:tetratricopeptide repeat protein [Agromyces endophyticus]|uniref:tetratricopeptide repeat protein n=1 Tax=Agromyces sp. H17E-10 TaxID=2932244 RepID=UPI001FD5FF04|nr:tetratricopeptide repeat protein [Agromyces sp. H17E-10]UOQ88903.1 tetratricopeptide repeat protein [Agromyces sp. H17E-10]